MSTRPTEVRLPGAVDLSALRDRASTPAGTQPGAGSAYVVDVTEATFQREVLDRSLQVPVVLDFWAEWCGPCKQLSPVLERFAAEDRGAWILAKIDVDANQRLAAAFQVQSIPTVFAVIGGQPVPLFQGAVPAQQVRSVLDEVLRVAAEQLSAAPGDVDGSESGAPEPVPPAHAAAQEALERGDVDAAAQAYRDVLAQNPGDRLAQTALARVELLRRTKGMDEPAVRRRGADAPDDIEAQTAVADLDCVLGRVDDAIGRLVDVVRRSSGDEREQARQHLLSLFEVLDPDDPRLAAGRRALANALF